jgi:hypothetical protein
MAVPKLFRSHTSILCCKLLFDPAMPAKSWTINRIDAENYYNVVTSGGITTPSGNQIIWDSTQNWVDGPTGSARPIVFCNTLAKVTAIFKINVYGTAAFPDSSRQGGSYLLVGYFNRKNVFQSPFTPVPASGNTVQVNGMYLMVPNFSYRQVAIPFRYGGDFQWYLWIFKDGKYSKLGTSSFYVTDY